MLAPECGRSQQLKDVEDGDKPAIMCADCSGFCLFGAASYGLQHDVLFPHFEPCVRPGFGIRAKCLLSTFPLRAIDPTVRLRRSVVLARSQQTNAEEAVALNMRTKGLMGIGE